MMTVALAVRVIRGGTTSDGDGVLRARGLIIEDEAGRERILVGAPIPEAVNRVRTDDARAREAWASRYPDPDAYMGYYQDYSHETNGGSFSAACPQDTHGPALRRHFRD